MLWPACSKHVTIRHMCMFIKPDVMQCVWTLFLTEDPGEECRDQKKRKQKDKKQRKERQQEHV